MGLAITAQKARNGQELSIQTEARHKSPPYCVTTQIAIVSSRFKIAWLRVLLLLWLVSMRLPVAAQHTIPASTSNCTSTMHNCAPLTNACAKLSCPSWSNRTPPRFCVAFGDDRQSFVPSTTASQRGCRLPQLRTDVSSGIRHLNNSSLQRVHACMHL